MSTMNQFDDGFWNIERGTIQHVVVVKIVWRIRMYDGSVELDFNEKPDCGIKNFPTWNASFNLKVFG